MTLCRRTLLLTVTAVATGGSVVPAVAAGTAAAALAPGRTASGRIRHGPDDRMNRAGPVARRPLSVMVAVAVIAAVVALTASSLDKIARTIDDPSVSDHRRECRRTTLPVALAPDSTTEYNLVGWLCSRGPAAGTPVQVLLSGLTYDHSFFDPPYRPDQYSYVRAAVVRRAVVFNVDRLGVGQSDRPPAALVTAQSQAYVAHQIVQALRRGDIGGTVFTRVIGVGHSFGAAIWIIEAAQYADIDATVLTSYVHQPNATQQRAIAATLDPAGRDPQFTAAALPEQYLTTRPDTRRANFYYPPRADMAMVRSDERLKQTATSGEQHTIDAAREAAVSRAIRVPVLIALGDRDSSACDATPALHCTNPAAVCAREAPSYHPSARLTVYLHPQAGHAINLHRGANPFFAVVLTWIDQSTTNHQRVLRPDPRLHTCHV